MTVLNKSSISHFIVKRKVNFIYKLRSKNYLLYCHLQILESNAFEEGVWENVIFKSLHFYCKDSYTLF